MAIQQIQEQITLPSDVQGLRLDAALAKCLPQYSRSQLTLWLKSGWVTVNGQAIKPKEKVNGGESVAITAQIQIVSAAPEDIELNIAYEDDDLFIVNKPAGLVMYPAAGHFEGTLMNAILHHAPECESLPRAGIIHRLDKGTTGLCVVAKNSATRNALVAALERREIKREYIALVKGEFIAGGTVDAPIERHPKIRTKQAVVKEGKEARTYYRINTRFCDFTLLDVTLDTGRTHQIRVHMSHIGHPLVGDTTYGWRSEIPGSFSTELREWLKSLGRPALHACRLTLEHPQTGKLIEAKAPIPNDLARLFELMPNA